MHYFVTSDLHLGHKNIIKHAGRPFTTLQEMDDGIIAAWNKVVRFNDVVFVLGDLCLNIPVERAAQYLNHLNGSKCLIEGNHDRKILRKVLNRYPNLGSLLLPIHNFVYGQHRYIMCHYPMETWEQSHYGSIHLHGHTHGTSTKRVNRFDVGVDLSLSPIRLEIDHVQNLVDAQANAKPGKLYEHLD